MLPEIAIRDITFAQPAYFWLLSIPAILLGLWVWRLGRLRADARRLAARRTVPISERLAIVGDFPFWLCLIVALTFLVLALARPMGPATIVRQAGIDLVILQDGSASMRVKDVSGDRWQRATRFLRTLGEAMTWKDDRIAMAVFARIAAPQVRLTKDPNTFFFFLDHLERTPPFRIEDDGTWDTNLELGIHWGLRVLQRDEEIHGKSLNAKVFVAISDGELWSGVAAKELELTRKLGVPVYAVGVGTLGGGAMPKLRVVTDVFRNPEGEILDDPNIPQRSYLDREGLQRVAAAGGGRYFELDRESDREIANTIIDATRRRAPTLDVSEVAEELYWYFLAAAAAVAAVGVLFLRERADLWIQLVGVAAAFIIVSRILT
jgi:Ca-activated chloride channel family protein